MNKQPRSESLLLIGIRVIFMYIYHITKGAAMKTMCIPKMVLIIIGFAVLTSYSGQWEVFTSKNDVRDIALSDTTLWAATTGGVVAWNLSDNSYTNYTTADGLLSCNINQVAIDKKDGRGPQQKILPVFLLMKIMHGSRLISVVLIIKLRIKLFAVWKLINLEMFGYIPD